MAPSSPVMGLRWSRMWHVHYQASAGQTLRPPQSSLMTRQRLKKSYFKALSMARIDRLLRKLYARDDVVLVLNFHRVSPDANPYWPPLTPDAFETLVAYLASACRVLTFDELADDHDTAASAQPRAIVSFDDGCHDFVEYAAPILARYRLRANHNVIIHSVESGIPPWMIRVVDALNAATTKRVRSLNIPGFERHLDGDDELAKTRYGTALTGYLKTLSPT